MRELSITIAGNVVSEVRVKTRDGGKVSATFRVAYNERRWNVGARAFVDEPPQFYDVTCWDRLAENVAACLQRGMPVIVRGRLSRREVSVEGAPFPRVYVDIRADHVGIDLLRGTAQFRRGRGAVAGAVQDRVPTEAMAAAGTGSSVV